MNTSELKAAIRSGLKSQGIAERVAAQRIDMTPPHMSRFFNTPDRSIRLVRLLALLDAAGLEIVKKG